MKGFKLSFYNNSGQLILLSNYDNENNNTLTFDENLTEEENNRYNLTFSIVDKISNANRFPINTRLINSLRIGRKLRLECENHDGDNYIDFIIISISPEGKPDNIVYKISAVDHFSYNMTRASVGITYDSIEDTTLLERNLDNNIFNIGNYLLERGHLQTAIFETSTYAVNTGSATLCDNDKSEIIIYDDNKNRWNPNIVQFYMELYTSAGSTINSNIQFTPTESTNFEYNSDVYRVFYSENKIHILINDAIPAVGTDLKYKLYYSYNISTFTGWQIVDNSVVITPDDILYKKYNLSISDSNTYNGLVELANLSDALIEVNYHDKYIYFYDKSNIKYIKNYRLSPRFNLENFSLDYDGEEFYSMFYVTGGQDEYGLQVTMLPYLDITSSKFLSDNVDSTTYIEGDNSFYTDLYNNTDWKNLVPVGSNDYNNVQNFISIANRNPQLDNFIFDLSYYEDNYLIDSSIRTTLLGKIYNDLRKINTKINYWNYIKALTESDIYTKEQSILTKSGIVVDEDQTVTYTERYKIFRQEFKQVGEISQPQTTTAYVSPTDYFSNTPSYPSAVLKHPVYLEITDSTISNWVTTNSSGIVEYEILNKYRYYFVFATPTINDPNFDITANVTSKLVATLMNNSGPTYARDVKLASYIWSAVPITPVSRTCNSASADISSTLSKTLTGLSFGAVLPSSAGAYYQIYIGNTTINIPFAQYAGGYYIYSITNQSVNLKDAQWSEIVSWVSGSGSYTYDVQLSTLEYQSSLTSIEEIYPFFELLNNYKGYSLIEEKEEYYRKTLIEYIKERQNVEAELAPLLVIENPTIDETLLISTLTSRKDSLRTVSGSWTYSESTDTITTTIDLGQYCYIYQAFLDYHNAGEYLGDVQIDSYTASGSTNIFTLTSDLVSVDVVTINSTILIPSLYTVDRNAKTITFTSTPSAGQIVSVKYRNAETILDKYQELYNDKHELLYEIYRDYGQYLIAGYYENDIETNPVILYNQALVYKEKYKKPAENYGITYLDISNVIGKDIKTIQVGDKINIFNGDLGIFEDSINEIQVTAISRDLRKTDGIQLTVNRQRDLTYLENIFLKTYTK